MVVFLMIVSQASTFKLHARLNLRLPPLTVHSPQSTSNNMNTLISTSFCCSCHQSITPTVFATQYPTIKTRYLCKRFRVWASGSNGSDGNAALKDSSQQEEEEEEKKVEDEVNIKSSTTTTPLLEKDLKKVVQKTAATFAPRASGASKNPAVPGSVLYTVFEVQAYASMFLGGILSFNLLFPSNEPDLWRLMGMWSIWMFTIPSLRARDCSKNEKEALNYLFILVPLLNVTIPFFWKSFATVWSADTIAFFGMYAWKMGWFQKGETK